MKVLVVISLLCMVNVSPSVCSIVEKFKEFEIVPDVLTVAPSKLLEVGVKSYLNFQILYHLYHV